MCHFEVCYVALSTKSLALPLQQDFQFIKHIDSEPTPWNGTEGLRQAMHPVIWLH